MSKRSNSSEPPQDPFGDGGDTAGRDGRGRFRAGNKAGKGNPYAAQVAKLRSTLLNAVTEKDIQEVAEALVRQAKEGSVPAAKELLERLLGPPVAADIVERLEALERLAAEQQGSTT
jgi:hypothetical protein